MKFIITVTILLAGLFSFSYSCEKDGDHIEDSTEFEDPPEEIATYRVDTFTFSSKGKAINGKIYLPDSFEKKTDLPAIFLIDYTEQHFIVAKDEFEKVIEGVQAIEGFDALVIRLCPV